MTWAPGQSGNPSGRTPEDRKVKRLAREHTESAIKRLVSWMDSENPKASVAAAMALLDRAWGKPKQAIVGGDEDDQPINLIQRIERVIIRAEPKARDS